VFILRPRIAVIARDRTSSRVIGNQTLEIAAISFQQVRVIPKGHHGKEENRARDCVRSWRLRPMTSDHGAMTAITRDHL
jgi:hypothetical protein